MADILWLLVKRRSWFHELLYPNLARNSGALNISIDDNVQRVLSIYMQHCGSFSKQLVQLIPHFCVLFGRILLLFGHSSMVS